MHDSHTVTLSDSRHETGHHSVPDRIVFFDGVCGLCNHTVNFLMARDRRGILRFAPLQGVTAQKVVPSAVREQLNTFVFANSGQLYYRSSALVHIMCQLGGIWSLLGALLWLIPWPIRDVGYRVVSALRYRLFGRHESCRIPTPEERARFLE